MAPDSEHYNDDELVAPDWLNKDFFVKVLQNCENANDLIVHNFELSPASFKGEHYTSVMFRVLVKYHHMDEDREMSMIVKTMSEAKCVKTDIYKDSFVFETEIAMYTEVIPKFEKILKRARDNTTFGARCLYYSLEPKKVIVLEDLVPQGYSVIRHRYANVDEVKAALQKLGKWHAVSCKVALEEPQFMDKFRYGLMHLPNVRDEGFFAEGIDLFIEFLDTQADLIEYKPYFEAMRPDLLQKCKASFREYYDNPRPDCSYGLCHGDFHAKNLMFKYWEPCGFLQDVKLLDFQLCYVGPLVNDFMYFFYALLNPELREHRFDEILYYYFTHFVETLRKINFTGRIPKLAEARQDAINHKYFEIYLLVTFFPLFYYCREENPDVTLAFSSREHRKKLYHNEGYIKELHYLLPEYLHWGLFDNL